MSTLNINDDTNYGECALIFDDNFEGYVPPNSSPDYRPHTPPVKSSMTKIISDYNISEIYTNFKNPNAIVQIPEVDKIYLWARGTNYPMFVVQVKLITPVGLYTKAFDDLKGEVEIFIPSEHQILFYLPGDVPVPTQTVTRSISDGGS
jgi:hypothetical protein